MKELFESTTDWTLFKLITIWITVISSIISFIAYFIKDYFLDKWRGIQQKEIETLRAQLDKSNLLIGNISNSISSTYLDSNSKRIEHIEKVWVGMMKMKMEMPGLVFMAYTILTKEEVENIPNDTNKYTQASIANFKPDEYINSNYKIMTDIENGRPFLGENLWIHFFAYQSFLGRLTVLIREGLKKGKVTYWKEDKTFIDQILKIVIKQEELELLTSNDIQAFHNVLNFIEAKVLNDISEQVMGKRMTEESVKHAIRLSQLRSNTVA